MIDENVKVENISKSYGKTQVLSDVNVNFEKGKIHGIVGRNGSGKTMLMKSICGFVNVDKGRVIVGGKEVGKDIDIPENMGIIIETPGFIPGYSGIKNLKILAAVRKKIKTQQIEEQMRKVELDPKSKKPVSKYSLGMRQKLGIVQAVMENPEILILDEPMNGLDNHSVGVVRKLLMEMSENGTTIIIASHNQNDIEILCDTIVYMDGGRIIKREERNK